jgi:hypothetical protein
MIPVRVRDEQIIDAQQLARRQGRHVTDIEQNRAPLELEVDQDTRVAELDQRHSKMGRMLPLQA